MRWSACAERLLSNSHALTMFKTIHFYALIGLLLGSRLMSMAFFPFMGTSEPRYAEIARLMLLTNDWITPWFSPDVPFWGKPPFSFWAQALSFKLLGINEFAVRLPSWLATLISVGLIYKWASTQFGDRVGQVSALIFGSCTLVFVGSGAVITDPYFALATTWAMVSYAMAQSNPHWVWRYGFFAALALGLLTKGPLVGVLVAGPLLAGLIWLKQTRHGFRAMPWFRGFILMLLLSLPWYILAELKTPGFLNYFLVGEHFYRFVDPGWSGDLYGSAHREPKGRVWIDLLTAALPWSLVALAVLLRKLSHHCGHKRILRNLRDPVQLYLISWALFTPLFFTFSGNILWTYVLPALPAFSILLALALNATIERNGYLRRAMMALIVAAPLACTIYFGIGALQPMTLKTEKYLVAQALAQMKPQDQLAYLGPIPFSATFYSKGRVRSIDMHSLKQKPDNYVLYLAIEKNAWVTLKEQFAAQIQPIAQSNHYVLIKVEPSMK